MHCIGVLIIKNKDVFNEIKVHRLNDILSACEYTQSNINELYSRNIGFLQIGTDYFGGCGEQECLLYSIGKCEELDNINAGLKLFGIIRTDTEDEFDIVNLGNYRTNDDFDFKNNEPIKLLFCEWLKIIQFKK